MKEDKNFSATGGVATRAGFLNARERRSVSDLLRHLAHPARLRNNAIARRYFRNGTAAGEAYTEGLRRLKRAIATALVQISPRQRTIIEQCDLGGELNSAVTRRLAISEGHFYRERQRALSAIGLYLISDVHERQTIAILPDAFTAASAQVALLQQLGDFARAIDKLHRITAGLTDSEQRVIAHCHLAELYSDAGQPGKAFEHSETASMLASQAHTKNEAMQLCAAAAHVTAQQLANEEVKGTPTATGLLVKLRAALHNGLGTPTREAFITIALLLAEQEIERGNPQMAAALCDEALSVSRSDDSVRPIFEHRAARWQTAAKCRILSTAHELTFAVAQSVGDLTCLVGSAVQTGQIVEACASAATLASLLRFVGRADEAVLILAPLVGTVLEFQTGDGIASAVLELSAAYVQTGHLSEAAPLIRRVQSDASAGAFLRGLSYQIESKAAFLSGSPGRALHLVREAIERMSSMGRLRFVGGSLHFQALVLEALGRQAEALDSVSRSIEYLREFGNYRNFLMAELDASRLAGDRQRSQILARRLGGVDPKERGSKM